MNKKYVKPELDLVAFSTADILSGSGDLEFPGVQLPEHEFGNQQVAVNERSWLNVL